MQENSPLTHCPGCAQPLATGAGAPHGCPRCRLPLRGPVPVQVREINTELGQLEARRADLTAHRARLLDQLWAGVQWSAAPAATPAAWGPPPTAGPHAAGPRRPETQPRTTQQVLLVLGGVLLAVALTAFTLLSWGHMGIAGRSVVLTVVTLTAMTAPVLLLRRALNATAECVACLGFLLLTLDAYALHRVALPGVDAWYYTGTAAAVIAAVWTAYGLLLPRRALRLPVPAALCVAQLAPLLWAVGADAGPRGFAWTLLATAACDALLALHLPPARSAPSAPPALPVLPALRGVRTTAAVTALVCGTPALLTALSLSAAADGPGEALRASVLLVGAAALLLHAARWHRPYTTALATGGGLCLVAATGGALRPVLPSEQWSVAGYLLCGVLLLAGVQGVRAARRSSPANGLLLAAGVVHAAALLWTLPPVARALFAPLGWAGHVWSGAPDGAREALAPGSGGFGDEFADELSADGSGWFADGGAVPLVLVLVTLSAVLAAASRTARARPWRSAVLGGAVATGGAVLLVLPQVLSMSYRAAIGVLLAGTVLLLLVAAAGARAVAGAGTGGTGGPGARARMAPVRTPALVTGTLSAVSVTGWALAEQAVTLTVLAVLLAAFLGAARLAPPGGYRGPAAAVSVLYAAGLAGAGSAALELPARQAAFALLAVAFAAQLVAAARVVRADRATGVPVEATGCLVALAGISLTLPHPAVLSLALGLSGVAAAGVALRADRRPAAGWVSGGLMVCATWTRLAASGVSAPEAYTLPVTVVALAMGLLRRHHVAGTSSWVAYGPGLSATLLPSLLAAWGDADWLRPLLLGTAALAVTLAGARFRQQAPLLLGGAVLVLVALHELAPYLLQVMGAVPRWAPPALAGMLLLAVGATYEQRLRDARRLRETLGRMR